MARKNEKPNTDPAAFKKGYGEKDYAHAKNEKHDWTREDAATAKVRREEYEKRLAAYKKGPQKLSDLTHRGETYEFIKGDTIYPALQKFFGMKERTAFLVMTKMLDAGINVDRIEAGDSLTLSADGDFGTIKFIKAGKDGSAPQEFTISDVLKPAKSTSTHGRRPTPTPPSRDKVRRAEPAGREARPTPPAPRPAPSPAPGPDPRIVTRPISITPEPITPEPAPPPRPPPAPVIPAPLPPAPPPPISPASLPTYEEEFVEWDPGKDLPPSPPAPEPLTPSERQKRAIEERENYLLERYIGNLTIYKGMSPANLSDTIGEGVNIPPEKLLFRLHVPESKITSYAGITFPEPIKDFYFTFNLDTDEDKLNAERHLIDIKAWAEQPGKSMPDKTLVVIPKELVPAPPGDALKERRPEGAPPAVPAVAEPAPEPERKPSKEELYEKLRAGLTANMQRALYNIKSIHFFWDRIEFTEGPDGITMAYKKGPNSYPLTLGPTEHEFYIFYEGPGKELIPVPFNLRESEDTDPSKIDKKLETAAAPTEPEKEPEKPPERPHEARLKKLIDEYDVVTVPHRTDVASLSPFDYTVSFKFHTGNSVPSFSKIGDEWKMIPIEECIIAVDLKDDESYQKAVRLIKEIHEWSGKKTYSLPPEGMKTTPPFEGEADVIQNLLDIRKKPEPTPEDKNVILLLEKNYPKLSKVNEDSPTKVYDLTAQELPRPFKGALFKLKMPESKIKDYGKEIKNFYLLVDTSSEAAVRDAQTLIDRVKAWSVALPTGPAPAGVYLDLKVLTPEQGRMLTLLDLYSPHLVEIDNAFPKPIYDIFGKEMKPPFKGRMLQIGVPDSKLKTLEGANHVMSFYVLADLSSDAGKEKAKATIDAIKKWAVTEATGNPPKGTLFDVEIANLPVELPLDLTPLE